MRISFLLPTRERLEYLKLAIETIRRQDSEDWEIVVSDNASAEDIAGYVETLHDRRIRYRRSPLPVGVTENWNAALEESSGDYVLMLGDDDGLLPGYVRRMMALIDRFARPDMIHTGALIFTYPGVDPAHPQGSLAPNVHRELFGGSSAPFVISHAQAMAGARQVMRFRLAFNFNMQLSLLSRRLIDELREHGDVFQSSFPDYYATTAAFITARTIVADPSTPVVIGVTPRSYGFFHINEREQEGRAFLGDQGAQALPGTNINDGWLSAVEAIEANFGAQHGLRVNHRRYRYLQALSVYSARRRGRASDDEVARLRAGLPMLERLAYALGDRIARALVRVVPATPWDRLMRRSQGQFPKWAPELTEGRYRDLLEVFDGQSETPASRVAG